MRLTPNMPHWLSQKREPSGRNSSSIGAQIIVGTFSAPATCAAISSLP